MNSPVILGVSEGAGKYIEAGFSSIMFDGSHYAIDENIAKTTELVKAARDKGLSIEAEVGAIGGEEDGVVGMGECADPHELLAPGVEAIKTTVTENMELFGSVGKA